MGQRNTNLTRQVAVAQMIVDDPSFRQLSNSLRESKESELIVDPINGIHIIYSDDLGNSQHLQMNEERMDSTEIELVGHLMETMKKPTVHRHQHDDGHLYRTKTISDTFTTNTHHLESDGLEEDVDNVLQVLSQMDTDRKRNSTHF